MRGAWRLFTLGLVGAVLAKFAAYYAWAEFAAGGVGDALCQFDCVWYTEIAEHLYRSRPTAIYPDQASWAFFPLYPLLVGVLHRLAGLDTVWSALAISAASFTAAAVVSLHYRATTRPGASPMRWGVTLLVYPFSLYFALPYTESLYLLLTVLLLWAFQARAAGAAGLATGLASATRPTGALAIPYLAVVQVWRNRAIFRRGLDVSARADLLGRIALPVALMPLGLAVYMFYLYRVTGDALAFSHVQASWSHSFGEPISRLYWAVRAQDYPLVNRYSDTVQAYAAIFALLVSAWQCWRGFWLEGYFLGATIIVAAASGLDSLMRYAMVNPVMLLAAGDVADRIRPRWLQIALATACVMVQVVLLRLWSKTTYVLM